MSATPKNNLKELRDQESLKRMRTNDLRQNGNYNHNNDEENKQGEKIQEFLQAPKESVRMNQNVDFTTKSNREFPSYLVVPSARSKEGKPASNLYMRDVNGNDL